jgi:hypothetical protein
MRKHLIGALALIAVATVATAGPGFTADNGTVAVSITAQAPPAPCLTVTPESADFGTLPFSNPSMSSRAERAISWTNCGTADENLYASATDASGPSGSWSPVVANVCGATNQFMLAALAPQFTAPLLAAPTLVSENGSPVVFPAGQSRDGKLNLTMPCQGSNGAGETKTLTATFTAVVP